MRNIDCERLQQAVDEHTGADVLSGRVLGGAISVFQNGTTVYQACIGHADVAKTRPVTSKTVFRLASMTKPITAAVTMAMVDQGRLSLDDPISKYLPYMKHFKIGKVNEDGEVCVTGEANTPITARHILTHTSGMGSGTLFTHFYRTTPPGVMETLAASVEWYASLPLSFEPFTAFEYSGTAAFDTLAHALEQIADMRYEELVKKLVLDPCEMVDTTFEPTAEQWGRMIEMHDYCNGQAVSSPTVSGCPHLMTIPILQVCCLAADAMESVVFFQRRRFTP